MPGRSKGLSTLDFWSNMAHFLFQLKNFLKNCSVPKYSSKLKLILTKLNENYTFVNNARNTLSLHLHETSKINAFETELKTKGPPLAKFWDQLSKSQNIRRAKQFTNNDKVILPGTQIFSGETVFF